MHKGYTVCRETYTFLHGMSKHKVHSLKNHFSENGLTPRTHGNSTIRPHKALQFGTILHILNFVQNYAEQHAIYYQDVSLDDVKVLPSSDSKKVQYNFV